MMDQKDQTTITHTGERFDSLGDLEPLPHLADSKVETLSLKYVNWAGSRAELRDENSVLLYTVDYKFRRPHLRVYDPDSTEPIAGVTYHAATSQVDINLRGQDLSMKTKSFWKSESVYNSLALQGQTMTWTIQNSGWTYKFICVDEQNLPAARFVGSSAWGKNFGKVELLGKLADDNAAREEILVTALTLAYYMRRRQQ